MKNIFVFRRFESLIKNEELGIEEIPESLNPQIPKFVMACFHSRILPE